MKFLTFHQVRFVTDDNEAQDSQSAEIGLDETPQVHNNASAAPASDWHEELTSQDSPIAPCDEAAIRKSEVSILDPSSQPDSLLDHPPNELSSLHQVRTNTSYASYSPGPHISAQYNPSNATLSPAFYCRNTLIMDDTVMQRSTPLITTSPGYYLDKPWPFTSLHEARLIHHYIVHLSSQFDTNDKHHTFAEQIPKRAAHYPILRNSIFAVASRHMSIMASKADTESGQYVSECLRILIEALEDPLCCLDENLLAAVIILRTHEEMSDNDELCHLFGTTRLLHSIASFAADGGLRECVSWIALRQHIYISLTSQSPFTINLEHYRNSRVFQSQDDDSWANRIVFIFADILTNVFLQDGRQISLEKWNELDADVDGWEASKPQHFAPLFVQEDPEGDTTPWPEVLMCSPAQVNGLQHFYLARIVLTIFDPRLARLAFNSNHRRKLAESTVRKHLRAVIGLAVSNDHVLPAMFQASHILAACGSHLSQPEEQQAAVEFLLKMHAKIGWRTSHIIQSLQEQWR